MIIKEIMGHWYKCDNVECDKKIGIQDSFFETSGLFSGPCVFCGEYQIFEFSNAIEPCTKEEALLYEEIQTQIKEGKLQSEHYWEK